MVGLLWLGVATALVLRAQTSPAPELAVYKKLDQAQRLKPHDAEATKAWLDEAARLATLAADHIERRRYDEAAVAASRHRAPAERSTLVEQLARLRRIQAGQHGPRST